MSSSISSQHNPYIIGRPIYEIDMFVGRDDLFRFVEDNLIQENQVILLHGQRRIGKSSVLTQIPNFVELEQFVFVSLSLEGQAQKTLGEVLSELAIDITEQLGKGYDLQAHITSPVKSTIINEPQVFSESFLPQVNEALGDKNLVLLLDEFDVLENHHSKAAVERFFPYMKSILPRHPKLYLVPVVGRQLDELPNLRNLFGQAPYKEVGLLREKAAKYLITKPAEKVLKFEPEAIELILSLTAGHPYFIQVLCFAVFSFLREEERSHVTSKDVRKCVNKAIELGEAGLKWFHDGLSIPEQVVFSAVAEAQEKETNKDFWYLLEGCGGVKTKRLIQAEKRLLSWEFIERKANYKSNLNNKVKIELVRLWLLQRHPLQQEVRSYAPTKEELLSLIRRGVRAWNRWRKKNVYFEVDLSRSDLSRIDLIGAELSGINLSKSNLSRSDLCRADLNQCNLNDANLSGADLSKADLSGADLSWADLSGADLSEAILNRSNCRGVNLSKADLSRSQALSTNFAEATFTGVCIQDWHINSTTRLENVTCSYVYLKGFHQERRPSDPNKNFAPDEFTKLFQKAYETVDLIFRNGVDWQAFLNSLNKLSIEADGAELFVQAIENKDNGDFVVRLTTPPQANKAEVEKFIRHEYETQLKLLESNYEKKLQLQGEQLAFYREQTEIERNLNTRLDRILEVMADNTGDIYNSNIKAANFAPHGTAVGGTFNDYSQTITNNLDEIQQLITALRSQAAQFPQDARNEVLEHLNDLQDDLQHPDKVKPSRLKASLNTILVITMGVTTTKDFTNNVLELASKFGVELVHPQGTQSPQAPHS